MIKAIDTHIHFDDERFDVDRDAVYQRAIDSGVRAMILPAVTCDRWEKLFNLTCQYRNLFATAGLHPCFMQHHTESHLIALDQALSKRRYVAVGECGLDGKVASGMENQRHYFHEQLQLSAKHRLPVIVHANGAVEDVIISIKKYGSSTTGVVHSYNGSVEQANRLIDMGYMMSFGGALTFSRATRLREVVRQIPLTSVMIETDAPDQPPNQGLDLSVESRNNGIHEKQRNEPSYLGAVINTIAEIKNTTPQQVADHSNANACELFNLSAEKIFQTDTATQ